MIIQNAPMRQRQSYQTERQMALQGGLENIIGGLASLDETLSKQQATERQKALDAQNLALEYNKQGYDVSPQDILAASGANQPTGLAALFQEAKAAPALDLSKRTKSYEQKLAQDQMDRQRELEKEKFERQYKMATLAEQRANRDFEKQIKQSQLNLEQQKIAQEFSPQGKLNKLGAEGRSKVGSIVSGMEAINKIQTAMNQGYEPQYLTSETPIIGRFKTDNPLTENQRVLTEVVGRLQSGGAISDDEGKRFNAMGPRPGDTPETQLRKLNNQREFLKNKLTAYGINETDLPEIGFNYKPVRDEFEKKQRVNFGVDAFADQGALITQPERVQARQDRIKFLKQKAGIP